MERLVQNGKHLVSAIVDGASAVCSGVVATGVASGLDLGSSGSLGIHLNQFWSI